MAPPLNRGVAQDSFSYRAFEAAERVAFELIASRNEIQDHSMSGNPARIRREKTYGEIMILTTSSISIYIYIYSNKVKALRFTESGFYAFIAPLRNLLRL